MDMDIRFIPTIFCLHVCSVMSDSLGPHGLQATRLLWLWDFPCKNTGVGCHILLQGLLETSVSCIGKWILYCLSQLGSPNTYYVEHQRQRENLQDIQGIHKDYIERNKTKGKFIRLLLRNYENQETMDSWSKSPPFKGLSFFLKPTVNSTSFDNSFEEGR